MKNASLVLILAVFILPAITFGAPAHDAGADFTAVEGKNWFLSELKSSGKTISIDRKRLEADGMGSAFSIGFQKENAEYQGRVSGMGAPNRFFGPYTTGSNRSLSMGNLASTMMAAFKEPAELKEQEFFGFLSKVTRWDLREGKLELYCSDSSKKEIILVFTIR